MQTYLKLLVDSKDLTYEEAKQAMQLIMSGGATDAQIASFLTAMRMKGETIDEITACAEVMRDNAEAIEYHGDLIDIVGTGGDCANTFNVSTAASLIVAATGAHVAKHGNRSVSSKCGAADVLEALGVKIDAPKERMQAMLKEVGICFMFAPLYHSSMKYVMPSRKQMSVRTIFNILGPLASPAKANLQLLGVYDEALVEPLAKVLAKLGVKRAMVVYGQDGLDEITLTGVTNVCEVDHGEIRRYNIHPSQFGFSTCEPADLVGGAPAENARIIRDILSGVKGHKRNMAVLNAAAALHIIDGGKSLDDCVRLAESVLDEGKALAKLNEMIAFSNKE